jgi:putative hemolysin
MVMWLLGRLPKTGDVATWEHWRLEVVDLDGKRIDKVLASPLPVPSGVEAIETHPEKPGAG